MSDNQLVLVGNLTDAPELRFTPQGTAVAGFRLAVTPRLRDGDGWRDGETSFFRVNVWRDLAEHVAESLSKGDRALVVGRLKLRSWETPEGEKRSVTEVEADEVGGQPQVRHRKAPAGPRGCGGHHLTDPARPELRQPRIGRHPGFSDRRRR
jgi:single-strand DNA-binding protein